MSGTPPARTSPSGEVSHAPQESGLTRNVNSRRLLSLGATLTALGIAIAATAPVLNTPGAERTRTQEFLGGIVLVTGWALLAWGIHQFGRGEQEDPKVRRSEG
jgi:hypothetical protein